jgi:hypothetical protein
MSIVIDGPWSEFGFLSNLYPSPFNSNGRRWRNVQQYIDHYGHDRNILLEAITNKFKSNPHLLVLLDGTGNTDITGDSNVLASVLMEVRDLLSDKSPNQSSSFTRMMVSLTDIIRKEGFTNTYMAGEEVDITSLQEGDYKIELVGDHKKGILDLYLADTITDKKIKTVISPYQSKGLKDMYILVGSLSRNTISKSLASMSGFHGIRYFSPSELLVEYSKHILTPRIEIVPETDPIHDLPIGSFPEISVDDPLIRQMGLRTSTGKRLILAVYDHSPHYRQVV